MKALLKSIIEPLIQHPEDLTIEEERKGREVVLTVNAHPDDIGRVIGRGGKRAQSGPGNRRPKARWTIAASRSTSSHETTLSIDWRVFRPHGVNGELLIKSLGDDDTLSTGAFVLCHGRLWHKTFVVSPIKVSAVHTARLL